MDIQGVLQKHISNLKWSYSKKYEINSVKILRVVKYFIVYIWKYLLTKYLETSCNFNLISNCYQFLMAFINRTRLLVGIVIFKAR